jgi:signal peptidase II
MPEPHNSEGRIRADLLIVAISAALSVALDRLTKTLALSYLEMHQSRPFLPGLLNFHLTVNTGAAFSLGHDNKPLVLAVASTITVALIAWTISRILRATASKPLERIGAGVLIGGAVGNLLDRLIKGSVTDFLDFAFINFPIFNVADMMIDLGIVLICLSSFYEPKSKSNG